MTVVVSDHQNPRPPGDDAAPLGRTGNRDRPPGSFFGRRKGHRLRPHQNDLVAQLLPRLGFDPARIGPSGPAALFDPPVDETRIEIGFGGGEHLVAEALA